MLEAMYNVEPRANMPLHQKTILTAVVYKRLRDTVSRALKPHAINITQWMVLGILCDQAGGQKISDIAHLLQVEVPLITTLSQTLLREGYVTQTADTQDRRSKPLTITARGTELITAVETQLTDRLAELEAGLSAETLTAYFTTLLALTSNAEQADEKV